MNSKYILAGAATAGTIGLGGWLIWSHSTVQQQEGEAVAPEVPPEQPPVVKKTYEGAISAETKKHYQDTALGAVFSDYLLDTQTGADKEWNDKNTKLSKKQPESGLFQVAYRQKTVNQLKTTCEQMFTYKQNEWKTLTSAGVDSNEKRKVLWKETWDYCAAAPENEMPQNWPSKTIQ